MEQANTGEIQPFDSGRSPTVLIIDDVPTNVKVLEVTLRREGYSTISAFNGADGEKLAEDRQPDLILLDIMMPGKSGFDTCVDLKQNAQTSHIPIIFLSAVDDVDSKVKGLSIGAVDYITKPFHKAEVLARTKLHLKISTEHQSKLVEQAAKIEQIRAAQQAMLVLPEGFPEARFGVRYVPILEAGGDFYDVFELGPGLTGYFVADVSGHDLGASFTTAALKALIRQSVKGAGSAVEALEAMNEALFPIFMEGKYLTAGYACIDRARSTLTFVSAGHPPAIYVPAQGNAEILGGAGDILGIFPEVAFEPLNRKIAPGDRLYLYTDGLVEHPQEGRYAREDCVLQLREVCSGSKRLPIDQAVSHIVNRMTPRHMLQDDVVLLGIEV